MSKGNKALATRWFEEVWNKGKRDAIAEMLLPNAVIYESCQAIQGPDGFYPFFDRMQAAVSDIHVSFHDAMAEGDRVVLRWSVSMRHTGDGLGVPPTEKVVTTTGISVPRLAGGKFIEGWQNWDMLGLMQQIQGTRLGLTYTAHRLRRLAPPIRDRIAQFETDGSDRTLPSQTMRGVSP